MKYNVYRTVSLAASFIPYFLIPTLFDDGLAASWFQFLLIEGLLILPLVAARNTNSVKLSSRLYPKTISLIVALVSCFFFYYFSNRFSFTIGLIAALIVLVRWFTSIYQIHFILTNKVLHLELFERILPALIFSMLLILYSDKIGFSEILLMYLMIQLSVALIAFVFDGVPRFTRIASVNYRQYFLGALQTFTAQTDQLILSFILPSSEFVTLRVVFLVLRNILNIATARSVFLLPQLSQATKRQAIEIAAAMSKNFLLMTIFGTMFGSLILIIFFKINNLVFDMDIYVIISIAHIIMSFFSIYGTILNAKNKVLFLMGLKVFAFIALNFILGILAYNDVLTLLNYALLFTVVHTVSGILQYYKFNTEG